MVFYYIKTGIMRIISIKVLKTTISFIFKYSNTTGICFFDLKSFSFSVTLYQQSQHKSAKEVKYYGKETI